MGKTSVYLTSENTARWHATGLHLGEIVRLGLEVAERGAPDLEGTLRRILREELAGLSVACSGGGQPGYGARGCGDGGYASEPFEDIP